MTAATLTRTISVDEESCEFPHVLDGVALNGAAAHLAGGWTGHCWTRPDGIR